MVRKIKEESYLRWYRHNVDRWQGSAEVAALSSEGYKAFHCLMMYQFQRPDGLLPNDERTLRVQSRLRTQAEWDGCRDEVLAMFEPMGDGKIANMAMYAEWEWSRERKEMCAERASAGGKALKEKREACLKSALSTTEACLEPAKGVLESATEHNKTEQEKEQEKIFAPSLAGVVASQPTERGRLIVSVPLIPSHGDWPVFEIDATQLQATYPAVDVLQQLRELARWCVDNPTRRKTKNGVRSFIGKWMAREQDRGSNGKQFSTGRSKSDRNLDALAEVCGTKHLREMDLGRAGSAGERAASNPVADGLTGIREEAHGVSGSRRARDSGAPVIDASP